MDCMRENSPPDCEVACHGIYADVTKRQFVSSNFDMYIPAINFSRDEEGEQSDEEKLMTIRVEYEKYKELWGLNLQYSHSAGAARNYSRLHV